MSNARGVMKQVSSGLNLEIKPCLRASWDKNGDTMVHQMTGVAGMSGAFRLRGVSILFVLSLLVFQTPFKLLALDRAVKSADD